MKLVIIGAGGFGREAAWTAETAGYRGFCGLEYAPLLPREESLARAKEILL